ncbi:MAG: hypothetical protein CMF62_01755 [Magnetococcales bacterium]|nr:hypothetical protein [Magnetococcales bacterium]|tara:strand:+ start:77707 stop:78420 length:714 start_codon:yes stop_codon:yes gene_type:complete
MTEIIISKNMTEELIQFRDQKWIPFIKDIHPIILKPINGNELSMKEENRLKIIGKIIETFESCKNISFEIVENILSNVKFPTSSTSADSDYMEIDSCFIFDEFSITKNLYKKQEEVKQTTSSNFNVKTQFDRNKFINYWKPPVIISKYDYLKPRIIDINKEDIIEKNPDDKYEVPSYDSSKYASEVVLMIQNVKDSFNEDLELKDYIIVEEDSYAEFEIDNFDDPILKEEQISIATC